MDYPSDNFTEYPSYDDSLLQHSPELTILISVAYGFIFFTGVLGNTFVVLAVCAHKNLNITTDYLILALALADLFILWVCLPTTLANNIFNRWLFGSLLCRLSTWANATSSCTSVYTLVAVTADRYLAICHTMKYNTSWDREYTKYVIFVIWIISAIAGIPNFFLYDAVIFVMVFKDGAWDIERVYSEQSQAINICMQESDYQTVFFVTINLCFAFVIPFGLILFLYTKIFITVSTHRSLAIDARAREDRVKLRVATMMLTVIISFAICWLPLLTIFTFFNFADQRTPLYGFLSTSLRPIFQWLSILSSSLNPIIYIAYSHKYRRAFKKILLMPCKLKYERVRSTILRKPNQMTQNEKISAGENVSFKTCTDGAVSAAY
ncbi:unnamed protein product [Caenorhabditis angaria]|uniref:G-protein coupled receptors family 1 profile domain-containing protein n=1 Tax=Caenorhabditis angaria TaxID=860376 RepID=A0A9P1INM4_9PELO|nr:unnamed protein product [Caenorhabditis angaria]